MVECFISVEVCVVLLVEIFELDCGVWVILFCWYMFVLLEDCWCVFGLMWCVFGVMGNLGNLFEFVEIVCGVGVGSVFGVKGEV